MPQRAHRSPGASVHVEVFVTARADRRRVVGACRELYGSARPLTERRGGRGPWLYLIERRARSDRRPMALESAVLARSKEDVWLEVTFYPSSTQRRSILRALWAGPRIRPKALAAESYNLTRRRSWLLGTGTVPA